MQKRHTSALASPHSPSSRCLVVVVFICVRAAAMIPRLISVVLVPGRANEGLEGFGSQEEGGRG